MSDKFYDNPTFSGSDAGDERTSLLGASEGDERTSLLSDIPAVDDIQTDNTDIPYAQPVYDDEGSSRTVFMAPQEAVTDPAEPVYASSVADDEVPHEKTYSHPGNTRVYSNVNFEEPYREPVTDTSVAAETAGPYVAQAVTEPQTENRSVRRTYRDGFTSQHDSYLRTGEHENPYTSEPEHIKKSKKKEPVGRIPASTIAFLLIICFLVSAIAGFGGSMLASRVNKAESENSSDSFGLNTIDTENLDYDKLEDKPTTAITNEVADTVVEITTEVMTTSSFYGQYITTGAGSGVIVEEDGYIITNNHVISGATSITVTTRSGDIYDATLIGTDSIADIALIKIDATGLPTATLGDSSKLKVGSKAVVIGNPLGTLGGSVTEGIISALDREIVIDGKTMHLMQTDAAINPGNSGGAMFDGQGLLSGIVVAKSSSEEIDNIGFVIPINDVKEIYEDLKESGYVRGRADTGMTFLDVPNGLFAYYYFGSTEVGVYVNSVESSSNAAKVGIQAGDRIVSVDGEAISSSSEITEIINGKSAGDSISFEISRRGRTKTFSFTLDEMVPEGIQIRNR